MQDHHHVWQVSYPASESRARLEQVAENSSVGKDSRSSGGPRQQRPNSGDTSRSERRIPNWMKLPPNLGDLISITHEIIGMRRSFWPFWPSSCLQSPQGTAQSLSSLLENSGLRTRCTSQSRLQSSPAQTSFLCPCCLSLLVAAAVSVLKDPVTKPPSCA